MSASGAPPPPPNDPPSSATDVKPPVSTTSQRDERQDAGDGGGADAQMAEAEPALPDEILNASTDEIMTRIKLLDNDIKVRRPALGTRESQELTCPIPKTGDEV